MAARRRQLVGLIGATLLTMVIAVALPVALNRLSPPETTIWILPHYYILAVLVGLGVVWAKFGPPRWTAVERWLAVLLPVLIAVTAFVLLTPQYTYSEVRCGPPPESPNDPGATCIDQRGEVVDPAAPVVPSPVPRPLTTKVPAVLATIAVALRLFRPWRHAVDQGPSGGLDSAITTQSKVLSE